MESHGTSWNPTEPHGILQNLMESHRTSQWRQEPDSGLLWVKGNPGKSKMMLLCGLIDELQSSMSQSVLLSYFFCQVTDMRINSATAVLRGLLYMLVTRQCKGLTLRVVARMISDEFNSFPANPESPLFVAGDPDRLCRVGRPSGWTSP
jgi:hypothetical protein